VVVIHAQSSKPSSSATASLRQLDPNVTAGSTAGMYPVYPAGGSGYLVSSSNQALRSSQA
jgi:hypothetical protein